MVCFSFLLLAGSFMSFGRAVFVSEAKDSMVNNAEAVVRTAESFARAEDLQSLDLRMMIGSIASSTGRHIFITTAEGYIFSCSDRPTECGHIGMQIPVEAMIQLSGGAMETFGTLGGFYNTERYVVARPFAYSLAPEIHETGYVFVTQDQSAALDAWSSVLPLFLLLCMTVLVIALVMAFVFSRRLSQPLHEMAEAARKFGHGDFSVRVTDEGREDELGELTGAFNSMAASLAGAEQRRSDFVANISHELKTPMTSIAGYADGILDGTIPPEEEKHYLEIISTETKRLSRLVRSMLELSRLQAEDRSELCRKSFDIAEVMRLTLINFADKIEHRGLDVDFEVPEDAVEVLGSVDAITQVTYNLLDNAIKFAKDGSTLHMSLWKDDEKAYISYRNEGETIPPEELDKLFDRFHKTDKSRSKDRDGVGLGLYIVKTILNNHGEDIAVTSRDGVTDFVFTLTLK